MSLTTTMQAAVFGSGGLGVPVEWLVFFLVFASVYGILATTGRGGGRGGLFGNNAVNTVIAIVFAFFAAGSSEFIRFFEANFSLMVWVFVGLFFLAFLLEVLGIRGILISREKMKKQPHTWVVIGGLALLLMITIGFGTISKIDVPIIGTNNALMVIGILFFAQMVLYALTGKDVEAKAEKEE